MAKFNETLVGSLVEPCVGFFRALFTGEYGRAAQFSVFVQLALQAWIVSNPFLSTGHMFLWAFALAVVHIVGAFLAGVTFVGNSFDRKPMSMTQTGAAGFVLSAVMSFFVTGLLAVIFGFGGVGFGSGLWIIFLSAVLGSALDAYVVTRTLQVKFGLK